MNIIEKLSIDNGCEWVQLGELAEIGTGSSNRQDEVENGIYPFYVRSKNILRANTFQFDETAIVVPGEGGIGDIFHYVEGKYALHQRAYRIHVTTRLLNSKFLYYFMAQNFKQYILMKSVGATSISIRKPMLEKFQIPIPCPENPEKSLQIQAEIVRILDAFTSLTAELTAELTARKKQYNYYRDKLLSFEDGEVEWSTLEKLFDMRAGQHISASKIASVKDERNNIPCFGGNGIRGYVSEQSHEGDFAIIGRQGALCGNVQRVNGQFYATEHAVVVTAKPGVCINWAYHLLTVMNLNQYASKSAQPGLAVGRLKGLPVPLPPKDEQVRIASILDKFDALTNSITEGLPREIELRQKQYEYYRDLLLRFPKPDEQVA